VPVSARSDSLHDPYSPEGPTVQLKEFPSVSGSEITDKRN